MVAVALAEAGVGVLIVDVHPRLNETVESIKRTSRGAVLGLRADVTVDADAQEAVRVAISEFGHLDVLANVAGIYKKRALLEMTVPEWDEMIAVNLRGVFLMTRHAVPQMVRQQYGRIVNIASGIGVRGQERASHYAASKAGVMAFTRSIAVELRAQNVMINCLAPGKTDTPGMRAAETPEEIEAAVARIGMPLGRPEDVVGPFMFLIGPGASVISGTTLWVRNP
jgi:3-oxoacyl-[acyl-carrier protein] reductase